MFAVDSQIFKILIVTIVLKIICFYSAFAMPKIEVLSTSGHTKGSVCYILEDNIFSGDTLFYNSFGTTGFPIGDGEAIKKSLLIV